MSVCLHTYTLALTYTRSADYSERPDSLSRQLRLLITVNATDYSECQHSALFPTTTPVMRALLGLILLAAWSDWRDTVTVYSECLPTDIATHLHSAITDGLTTRLLITVNVTL